MRIYNIAIGVLLLLSPYMETGAQKWKVAEEKAKEFFEQEIYDSAVKYFQYADKALVKDSSGTISHARILLGLAESFFHADDYEHAEPIYQVSRKMFLKKPDLLDSQYVALNNNLARIYMEVLNFEEAEKLSLENVSVVEKKYGKESFFYAKVLANLGSLYLNMREFDKAEAFLKQALPLAEKYSGKESRLYAVITVNLGAVYYSLKQYTVAEPYYIQSRNYWESKYGKLHPEYARASNNLGILYTDMGLFEKAETFTREARNVFETLLGKQNMEYANATLNLAMVSWNLKKIDSAHTYYLEAFNSQYNYYIKNVFNFISEEEKYHVLRDFYGYSGDFFAFNSLGYPHDKQGDAYNVSLALRNIVLSSTVNVRNAIQASGNAALVQAYTNWLEIKETLAGLYSSYDRDKNELAELEREANELEKYLVRSSKEFSSASEQLKIDWTKIKQSLKPGEAAIEFIDHTYFNGRNWADTIMYMALLLRHDKPEPILVPLFKEYQLQKLLNSRNSIDIVYRGLKPTYDGQISDSVVFDLVWRPLEKELEGVRKIYFAPSGLLQKLSFAALPVSKDTLLSDKYTLEQLNTTASIASSVQQTVMPGESVVLYGGINYSNVDSRPSTTSQSKQSRDQWPFLAGTQNEVEAISSEATLHGFNITLMKGKMATEASVKTLNGKKSPTILHIATHGFFFPEPSTENPNLKKTVFETSENPLMRSGLVFAGANDTWRSGRQVINDGILTAYEVSNLYLPNTKLIVLSACETGLGDLQSAEGVFGLQRAFKMSGVNTLLMSLWKVPDAETAEFMKMFYERLFKNHSVTDAFNFTQNFMKDKYRKDPVKWAAWILVN